MQHLGSLYFLRFLLPSPCKRAPYNTFHERYPRASHGIPSFEDLGPFCTSTARYPSRALAHTEVTSTEFSAVPVALLRDSSSNLPSANVQTSVHHREVRLQAVFAPKRPCIAIEQRLSRPRGPRSTYALGCIATWVEEDKIIATV